MWAVEGRLHLLVVVAAAAVVVVVAEAVVVGQNLHVFLHTSDNLALAPLTQ